MFNRNEWLQWAQQSQNKNTEMNDFRNDYWRKNDATKSYMNPNRTVREDSQKNEPIELVEGGLIKKLAGGVKDTAKAAKDWALGTDRPIKVDPHTKMPVRRFYPKKYPFNPNKPHYVKGKEGQPHPEAGETIRVEPKERWAQRAKSGAANLGSYGAQYAVFTLPSPFGRNNPERVVGQSSREFDEESTQQLKTTQKNLEEVVFLAPLAGLLGLGGAGAAGAGAAKALGTTALSTGAKMAAKQGIKQTAKQTAKKTLKQKTMGVAGQVGTDVATYGAMNKLSGGGKPKQNTTAQMRPNTIQQNTGPIAKIEPSKPQPSKPQPRRLAASYDPEGTELLEILGKVLMKGGKVVNKKPKLTPLPGRTPLSTGNPATSAGNAAAKSEKLKKIAGSAGNAAMTAGAFTLMTPKQKADTTAQVQNPTGTARDSSPLARIGPDQQRQRMAASYDPEGTELNG